MNYLAFLGSSEYFYPEEKQLIEFLCKMFHVEKALNNKKFEF